MLSSLWQKIGEKNIFAVAMCTHVLFFGQQKINNTRHYTTHTFLLNYASILFSEYCLLHSNGFLVCVLLFKPIHTHSHVAPASLSLRFGKVFADSSISYARDVIITPTQASQMYEEKKPVREINVVDVFS